MMVLGDSSTDDSGDTAMSPFSDSDVTLSCTDVTPKNLKGGNVTPFSVWILYVVGRFLPPVVLPIGSRRCIDLNCSIILWTVLSETPHFHAMRRTLGKQTPLSFAWSANPRRTSFSVEGSSSFQTADMTSMLKAPPIRGDEARCIGTPPPKTSQLERIIPSLAPRRNLCFWRTLRALFRREDLVDLRITQRFVPRSPHQV